MINDKQLKKLNEAYAEMALPVQSNEAAVGSNSLDGLRNLLSIEDNDTDVDVNFGWKRIAAVIEDNGRWFPYALGKPISTGNYATKEAALVAIITYFKNDD